ncbi:hypothetical protein SLEP1_g3114 [Rubroshorea leprosula]|uniref:Uncharacterized protein n=1 Tax=Rubroshorea leprosula TaxID=152421 RepID=A0AAV5HTP6_9ROSI|nr:hypothetical protein SLEP1_g3114 [Rubroshorea leprosula]
MQWEDLGFVLCNSDPADHKTQVIFCHDWDAVAMAKQDESVEIWHSRTDVAILQREEKHQVMAPQLDRPKSPVQRLEAKRKKSREAPLPERNLEGRGPPTANHSRRSLEQRSQNRTVPYRRYDRVQVEISVYRPIH